MSDIILTWFITVCPLIFGYCRAGDTYLQYLFLKVSLCNYVPQAHCSDMSSTLDGQQSVSTTPNQHNIIHLFWHNTQTSHATYLQLTLQYFSLSLQPGLQLTFKDTFLWGLYSHIQLDFGSETSTVYAWCKVVLAYAFQMLAHKPEKYAFDVCL